MTMKKLLLVLGYPSHADHPSIDCLLAASLVVQQERGSRFLIVPHAGNGRSTGRLKETVDVMLSDLPRVIKIVYIDCAPNSEDEAKYLRSLKPSEVSIYIFDHHDNPLMSSLTPEPNVSYTCSALESTAAMASRFYYRSCFNELWTKILVIQHFICFHDIEALDGLFIEETSLSCLMKEVSHVYHNNKLMSSELEKLFYVTRHIIDYVASFDWSFANHQLDLYQRTGLFLDRIILTRAFIEDVMLGKDKQLFSNEHLNRYQAQAENWCQLINSAPLVSISLGEKVRTRFIAAVLVRPHQNRHDAGDFWMIPKCATAMCERSKALCLVDCSFKVSEEIQAVQKVEIRIYRAASTIDCLEVALSLAAAMAPAIVTVSGWSWKAVAECSETSYNRLEEHLKICRRAVEFSNVRPLPEFVPPQTPKPPKRASRQSVSRKSVASNGRASMGDASAQLGRGGRNRSSAGMCLGSDSVFDN